MRIWSALLIGVSPTEVSATGVSATEWMNWTEWVNCSKCGTCGPCGKGKENRYRFCKERRGCGGVDRQTEERDCGWDSCVDVDNASCHGGDYGGGGEGRANATPDSSMTMVDLVHWIVKLEVPLILINSVSCVTLTNRLHTLTKKNLY